jgi:hypothetical protein
MKKNTTTKVTHPLNACAAMIIEEMKTPDALISFLVDAIEWSHSYLMLTDLPSDKKIDADPHYELSNFMLIGMALPWLKASAKSEVFNQKTIAEMADGLKELQTNIGADGYRKVF